MRFMIIRKADQQTEAGVLPTEEILAVMGNYMQPMNDAGILLGAASREEAIEWAKRWPALGTEEDVELEIRQLYEADDFGEEFTPELRAQEDRMRADAEARK